jgi:hypothetical protein
VAFGLLLCLFLEFFIDLFIGYVSVWDFPGFYGRWYLTFKPKKRVGFGCVQQILMSGRSVCGWDMMGFDGFWF